MKKTRLIACIILTAMILSVSSAFYSGITESISGSNHSEDSLQVIKSVNSADLLKAANEVQTFNKIADAEKKVSKDIKEEKVNNKALKKDSKASKKKDKTVKKSQKKDKKTNKEEKSLGTFKVTAYCGCSACCGKSNGITASGTKATEGRTIAADTSKYPFGTELVIDGKTYVVEDRGGAISGNRIDIYFNSHSDALQWGVRYCEVKIK